MATRRKHPVHTPAALTQKCNMIAVSGSDSSMRGKIQSLSRQLLGVQMEIVPAKIRFGFGLPHPTPHVHVKSNQMADSLEEQEHTKSTGSAAQVVDNDICFNGRDQPHCEIFILSVNRKVLAAGKHSDDRWAAHYAATCISGSAFRWLELQDDDVQGSWTLLRRALLDRYSPKRQVQGSLYEWTHL